MHAHRIAAATSLLALTLLAGHAHGQAVCDPSPNPPPGWCTSDTLVTVVFNPSLDPRLEFGGFGNAASRQAAFTQAISDWNTALATVGAKMRLVGQIDAGQWATDMNTPLCADAPGDPFNPTAVFSDLNMAHHPDAKNAVSTGHNHGGIKVDGLNNVLGPGWITPTVSVVADTMVWGNLVPADNVLALTSSIAQGAKPNCAQEVDIAWYTHYNVAQVGCARISWDFSFAGGPAAGRIDFYSVMLHELGHLLGLDHQGPDQGGNNVMQGSIAKGVRRVIGPKERACLCALYGGAGCLPTPATPSSWGRLKTLYR